ncbi:hypothetical protein TNCV_3488491 [Trichonephila clavipes]|nr:hypothetical protein TNCV_3488491 [Trichonephila clavipes]
MRITSQRTRQISFKTKKNNQRVYFRKLVHTPKWPRDRAVVDCRIATGHDCLLKHINIIELAQSSLCKLCDSSEEIDAIHLAHCRALSSGSIWSRYFGDRHKMCGL